jgi:hypothetical protein
MLCLSLLLCMAARVLYAVRRVACAARPRAAAGSSFVSDCAARAAALLLLLQ